MYIDKKLERGNTIVFDIETTVLNKYTDERVGEVYSIVAREIYDNEVKQEIENIKNGKIVNLNNGKYLKTFLSERYTFRTMRQFVDWLREMTVDCKRDVYAHNLDYEDNALRCELEPNSLKNVNKINNYFEYKDLCIFRTNNNPISLVYEELENICFKCSYALTGYSISKLGKMIGIPKLDYDYEVERRPYDDLTELDIEYNDNDVVISACAIIQKALMRKEAIEDLPLTFTSEMNRDKSNFIREHFGEKSIRSLIRKRKQQLEFYDYDFYKLVKSVRQGGLTALNSCYINKIIENVASIDITSSYPYIMCFTKFARYGKDTIVLKLTEEHYYTDENGDKLFTEAGEKMANEINDFFTTNLINGKKSWVGTPIKGWFGTLILSNIKAKKINGKPFPFLPLSSAKITSGINNKTDRTVNGKVITMEKAIIKINDIDYEQLLKCYDFEFIGSEELYISTKEEYLSTEEISFIFDLFLKKQELKPFKDVKEAEYMHSKSNINANYGKKQQDFMKGSCEVINGEVIFTDFNKKRNDKFESKYQNLSETEANELYHKMVFKRNSETENYEIDIMTDGAYISSKAKLRLLEMCEYLFDLQEEINKKQKSKLEIIPLYCDTDSLKFTVKEKNSSSHKATIKHLDKQTNKQSRYINIILQKISKYNQKIITKNSKCYRFTDFCDNFNLNKNSKEVKCILELGTWDIENKLDTNKQEYVPYNYFKSLGAKKYLIIEGEEVKTTVAGLTKGMGKIITEYCKKNNENIVDIANEIFNLRTLFCRSISGRTTAYKEERSHEEINQMSYKGKPIVGYGCKMIENAPYTLDITENDYIYSYNTYYVDRKKTKRVFLRNKEGKILLLRTEKEINNYFKQLEVSHEKYVL